MDNLVQVVNQITDGIKQALEAEGIQVANFTFYHLFGSKFCATALTAENQYVMAMSDQETGEFNFSEHDPNELKQIQQRLDTEKPGAKAKWIGQGTHGEFALYELNGKMGNLSLNL